MLRILFISNLFYLYLPCYGFIVQGIEWKFPKLQIPVRIWVRPLKIIVMEDNIDMTAVPEFEGYSCSTKEMEKIVYEVIEEINNREDAKSRRFIVYNITDDEYYNGEF